MKNQNDLIAMIVAFVLTIIVVVLCFTVFKRQEIPPTPPAQVVTATPALPKVDPVMAASLPKGTDRGGGGGGGLPSFGGAGSMADAGKINASGTSNPVANKKMMQPGTAGG